VHDDSKCKERQIECMKDFEYRFSLEVRKRERNYSSTHTACGFEHRPSIVCLSAFIGRLLGAAGTPKFPGSTPFTGM
jgi:hypothetical protein